MKTKNRILPLIIIVLASLAAAIAITGALYHLEGKYAEEHGNLLISSKISGGEWMGEKGLFWTVGKTYPLSDGIHSEPSRTTLSSNKSAVINMIPLIWLVLSFVISLIAKIPFKKNMKALGIELLITLIFLGGIHMYQDSKLFESVRERNIDRTSITQMEIYTNALNNDNAFALAYPHIIYTFNPEGETDEPEIIVKSIGNENSGTIISKKISAPEMDEFLAIIDKIKADPTSSQEGAYSYYILITYTDKENYSSVVRVNGSGGFPECWPEFAEKVNEICHKDILVKNPVLFDEPSCSLQALMTERFNWNFR